MSPSAAIALPEARAKAAADATLGLRIGIGLSLAALASLALIQYALPPHASAHYWGLNPEGMQQFRAHWGLTGLKTLGPENFSLGFRLLLVALWSGYALAILSAWQGAALRARPVAGIVVVTALMTAVFAPPLLSHDVYAYAAHGRLAALYGRNPYFHLPAYLAAIHDPVAGYVTWNWPTVYGSVWTRLEILLVTLLQGPGLWAQVVALKLVEAGALIGAAFAGRRIAARLSPGHENLTMLAIGLNPLLLLEGPGSGHNDLLLVCLLLVGTMFYVEKNYAWAALFLGMSVGIKLITLAVLPWAWMEWGRGRPWRHKLLGGFVALLLTLLPTLLCYLGLWHGGKTLTAMQQRAHMSGGVGVLIGLAVAFGAITLWLALRPRPGQWLTAWAILAALLMFFALGLPFPWYMCWFWPICLLRWDKVGLGLSAACFGLSLAWTAGYGVLNGM